MAASPEDMLSAMKSKIEKLHAEKETLETRLQEVTNTIAKAEDSYSKLDAVMKSVASEWGLSTDANTRSEEEKPKKAKKMVKAKTKDKSTPALAPAPAPAPETVSEEENAPASGPEPEDEDVIEVDQDGVRYVVFLDTNEVAEADDEEETIVGKWDPSEKKVVLEV